MTIHPIIVLLLSYDTVKSLTNNTIGVQTQCIDVTKFETQETRQDQ